MRKLFLILLLLSSFAGKVEAVDYTQDVNVVRAYLVSEGSGTTIDDASASAKDLSFKADGEPAWASISGTDAPTYADYMVDYDGTNDYTKNDTRVFTAASARSVVAWGYIQNPQPGSFAGRIVSERQDTGWFFGVGTNNVVRLFHTGSTNLSVISNTSAFTINEWEHLAFSWDGSVTATNVDIYVNGVEVTYATQTNGVSLSNANGIGTYFGQDAAAVPTGTFLDWKQSETAIFNDVLTPTEINDIMDNGLVGSGAAAAVSMPMSAFGNGIANGIGRGMR